MKITDIQIEQFGVWNGLSLPLTSSGLNVFYGPNEAGKTTLMRFIRGVLHGFEPLGIEASKGPHRGVAWEGLLRVDHEQKLCEIRRASQPGGPGLVAVTGMDCDMPAEELLARLLADTTKNVFDHLFAIGLHELQELATLQDDDVAKHIYDLTLGVEGQRLLDAAAGIEREQLRLLNQGPGVRHQASEMEWPSLITDSRLLTSETGGELAERFEHYEQLAAETEALDDVRERHADLCRERDRLHASISDLKSRGADMQSRLRDHLFLERLWTPWNRVRQCRAELDQLPVVAGFPEGGPARLDELDAELAAANNGRDALLAEASQLRKQADAMHVDPEILKHAATIQSFIDQREWMTELGETIASAESHSHELKQQLDVRIADLGDGWSCKRLESVDTSAAGHLRMVSMARRYQSSVSRRAKLRRLLKRLSHATHRRLAVLNERLKGLGGRSIDEALAATRQELADLEDLGRIKLRETELEQRRVGINDQLSRLERRLSLPKWVYAVLTFFGVFGVIFAVLGIVTGVMTSGLGGAMYALLGTTCGLMAWALKSHFEKDVRESVERLRDEARENEARLRETRQAIDRLSFVETVSHVAVASPAPHDAPPATVPIARVVSPPDATACLPSSAGWMHGLGRNTAAPRGYPASSATLRLSEAELIRHATHRLAELEQLARTQQRIQSARRRLSSLRSRLQGAQREVGTARQNWCELLRQLGFSETVRVDEAFENWQRIVEACEQHREWQRAIDETRSRQRTLQSFRQRIEDLGRRVHCWDLDYGRPLDVLAAWEEELKVLARNQSERRRLRRDLKRRQSQAAEHQSRIDEVKMQRSALLVQAGAATPEEFQRRAEFLSRRRELEEQQAIAAAELETVIQAEPQLAVVEEDLLAYNAEENGRHVDALNRELEELEGELQQAFEKLGGLKQEIDDLENDRRSTRLRFDRHLAADRLKQAAEQWFALLLAARVVERMRTRFERTHQPATLSHASQFLERLTGGKYCNIWTPLGERHLCIDDGGNETWRVEELSGGTREQLFLAIRLALVRDFARKGIELPMVLDDVIVNFDQLRSEAAVETLIEFAAQGQQILLFTCHLHLAHMFEAKGIEPIWLPGHNPPIEERRAG